ncbi:MAG: LacI family DNA-binding transcriptional regulator [bacterium]
MVTIKDVAKLAGVSITTVSYVINKTGFISDETRAKVLRAIDELKYRPSSVARSLRRKRTNTVGLILSHLKNPFVSEMLRGVEVYLSKRQYAIIVADTNYDIKKEERLIDVFCSKRVDGIIINPVEDSPSEHIRFLVEQKIPIVVIDRKIRNLNVDTVLTNNVGASRQVIEHLLHLGHRRIGIITGPLNCTTGRERLEGYQKTLRERSIPENESLIKIGDYKERSGYLLGLELIDLALPPTVIFACNNLMALGAMRALGKRRIRVPEQMGIVAFDDLPWFTYVDPPLTAIATPTFELGETAARLLVSQLQRKRKKPKTIIIDAALKTRGSAGETLKETCLVFNRDL